MQIVELYSWLSSHKQEAAKLYSLVGTSDIQNVAAALSPYRNCSCDEAVQQFISEHFRVSAVDQMHISASRKLLAQPVLTLYHGNKDAKMIPKPNVGKDNCDFGQGFYTTPDKGLGCEWAYSSYTSGDIGYLHTYTLNQYGLNVLNFVECNSLCWVAEILSHRVFKLGQSYDEAEILKYRLDTFISRYKVDTSMADVIVGYRADDSYFKYASDFLKGLLFRETLDKVLYYGDLGLQVFIKSPKAFSALTRISVDKVPTQYHAFYKKRDNAARAAYERNKNSQGKTTILNYI